MQIGLYFGSFNPVHIGHLIIASHILNETALQKIWFVVSPQNPFKPSDTLMNEYDRYHLVQKAVEGDDRLRASDIEFSLPKPSYTVHTLAYLKEKYPSYEFHIIMGSDSFQNIRNWKNADVIVRDYPIIIYERPGFEVKNEAGANVHIMKAPLLQISATHIRELLRKGKSIKYLVPASIEEEVMNSAFYKRSNQGTK
jgi:nicotinate-nucleotide adenylyltransferase